MRRTILVSLAAGSVLTSIAWLFGNAFARSESDHLAIAVMHKEFLEPGKHQGLSNEQWWAELSPGRLILECGATSFMTEWNGGSHTTPVTFVEMTHENIEVANCIFEKAPEEGFEFKVSGVASCVPIGLMKRADWRTSVSC